MKKLLSSFVLAAAVALISPASAHNAAEVGKPAPDFSLTDLSGKQHKLADYHGKTVVLEWINPECPFVVKHYESGNIPSLQKAAAADGVVWLAINSAAPGKQGDYAPDAISAWMNKMDAAPAAYLRDSDGNVGKHYHAKTTPHMYVIDPQGTLVYAGAIDSIRSTKTEDIAKATNYVTAALTSLKAGKPVEKSMTEAYGCPVKY